MYGSPAHRALDAAELNLWLEFDRVQPIGDARAEFHAALIASTISNMAGKSLPTGKGVAPVDFMPLSFNRTKETERASFDELALRMGAKVTRS